MSRHVKLHDADTDTQKVVWCPKCGGLFGEAAFAHHRPVCGTVWKYPCQLCSGGSDTVGGLQTHHFHKHGETKKICDLCGKKFPCTSKMLAHRDNTACQRAAANKATENKASTSKHVGAAGVKESRRRKPAPKARRKKKQASASSKTKSKPNKQQPVPKKRKEVKSASRKKKIYAPTKPAPRSESGKEKKLQRRHKAATKDPKPPSRRGTKRDTRGDPI